jgi:Sugar (and other) transporter
VDGSDDFYPIFCAFFTNLGMGRGNVWCVMGRFSGINDPSLPSFSILHLQFYEQTLSTTYACEVVPTVLRPYVTAYVCMCWGAGILLSSGVVRAVASLEGDLGWRLPFAIQWVWPVPLFIGSYFAPESPWNAVRRGELEIARRSLMRLRRDSPEKEKEVEATLAYIRHTTQLEIAETENASFFECFQGTNLRRTEIVRFTFVSPSVG